MLFSTKKGNISWLSGRQANASRTDKRQNVICRLALLVYRYEGKLFAKLYECYQETRIASCITFFASNLVCSIRFLKCCKNAFLKMICASLSWARCSLVRHRKKGIRESYDKDCWKTLNRAQIHGIFSTQIHVPSYCARVLLSRASNGSAVTLGIYFYIVESKKNAL